MVHFGKYDYKRKITLAGLLKSNMLFVAVLVLYVAVNKMPKDHVATPKSAIHSNKEARAIYYNIHVSDFLSTY